MPVKLKGQLLPKQYEYVMSTAPEAMYCGGVGAGKTIADVAVINKFAIEHPGIEILACAPTYAMLRDTLMREFTARTPPQILESFREGIYPEAVYQPNNGRRSTVRFRSFDDPGKPKGPTYGLVVVDEVTEMKEAILEEITRRLRQLGMPNYLRMSTNPDSKEHYVYQRWVGPFERGEVTKDEFHYIGTTTFDNFLLPESYLAQQRKNRLLRPGHYMRSNMGEWGDFFEDRIGAFEEVPAFATPYLVAFIDSSYSDRNQTDRTAVTVCGFVPQSGRERKFWPVQFTGKSWEKSISNPDVIRDLLLFLDRHKPVETCLESQLGDSTRVFIDHLKEQERKLGLSVRNHWTWFHQTKNKHERIMLEVAGNKDRLFVLAGTDPAYLNRIVNYAKGAAHEDEIDSLAGGVSLWLTSKALAEFIRRVERRR